MEGSPIPETSVQAALSALKAINPPLVALQWEYQDAQTTVLFEAEIGRMSEDDALAVYDAPIRAAVGGAIPETGAFDTWMVVLKDRGGTLVAAVSSAWGAL